MVNIIESKSPNDPNPSAELYTELQELLQNKSLGLKQISALGLKNKAIHKPKSASSPKKIKTEKSIVIKKSVVKSRIGHGKSPT